MRSARDPRLLLTASCAPNRKNIVFVFEFIRNNPDSLSAPRMLAAPPVRCRRSRSRSSSRVSAQKLTRWERRHRSPCWRCCASASSTPFHQSQCTNGIMSNGYEIQSWCSCAAPNWPKHFPLCARATTTPLQRQAEQTTVPNCHIPGKTEVKRTTYSSGNEEASSTSAARRPVRSAN